MCQHKLHEAEAACYNHWQDLPLMQKVKMLEACTEDGQLTLGELLAKLVTVNEMLRDKC